MKIAAVSNRDVNASELDMLTIRRRVASIKNRWTHEEAQARAAEGARRRRELDVLVSSLIGDLREDFRVESSEAGEVGHGLTLVG